MKGASRILASQSSALASRAWLLPLLALTLVLGLAAAPAQAMFERYEPDVVVSDPFIELRTGPGRGYPIFYVAGQGDQITLLKRRTDWYKIRGPRDKEGWVHVSQIRHTLNLDGEPLDIDELGLGDFSKRRWEMGVNGGEFGGAASITGYLGYAMTPNITLQVEGTQILGNFSDGLMASANILMYPFPKKRISPYFMIGTGIIKTQPHSRIVEAEDRSDEIAHAGVGANFYLSDRFILRMEYKRHTVFTSRDDNEEVNQWKAGFSVFF